MGFGVIRYLVAHAGLQDKSSTVFELGMKLAFSAQDDVPFDAPVIREIARRVFDHAYADDSEMLRAPVGEAALAFVLGRLDFRPVSGSEWNVRHLHCCFLRAIVPSVMLKGSSAPNAPAPLLRRSRG